MRFDFEVRQKEERDEADLISDGHQREIPSLHRGRHRKPDWNDHKRPIVGGGFRGG